jgi:hypothetical protein
MIHPFTTHRQARRTNFVAEGGLSSEDLCFVCLVLHVFISVNYNICAFEYAQVAFTTGLSSQNAASVMSLANAMQASWLVVFTYLSSNRFFR